MHWERSCDSANRGRAKGQTEGFEEDCVKARAAVVYEFVVDRLGPKCRSDLGFDNCEKSWVAEDVG